MGEAGDSGGLGEVVAGESGDNGGNDNPSTGNRIHHTHLLRLLTTPPPPLTRCSTSMTITSKRSRI